MGGVCVWHCAAISGFWAASRARFARYRSTHLQGEVGLHVRSSLSDKYCAAILPVLGLDRVSGMRYRSTHPGRGARDVRELGSSVRFGSSDKYCAAISGFWASFRPCFGQYRSTVLVAPDLRVEWDEVASLVHAPGGASQSNRGHMRITSNSELRAQLALYYNWVQ